MDPSIQSSERHAIKILGRYALYDEIAAGGMATVHLARLMGPVGFSRTVAIKRLHPHLAKDPEFATSFLDEARLAARIRHPNVVPTLDVVALSGELFLVMEYIHGESLGYFLRLARTMDEPIPLKLFANVLAGALHGLHAAHEAKSDSGKPLGIVHRDVSPQNVLVGVDGVPRVVDFGVAKAAGQVHTTREGQLKGKIAYMAPEQITGETVTRQTDIFSAAAILWEGLAGRRLFAGANEAEIVLSIVNRDAPPPSKYNAHVPKVLDDIVLRGLEKDPARRFATAKDMASALEHSMGLVSGREIGEWVEATAHERLSERSRAVADIESISAVVDVSAIRSSASTLPPPRSSVRSLSVVPSRRGRRRDMVFIVTGAAAGILALAILKVTTAKQSSHVETAVASAASAPSPPPTTSASAAEAASSAPADVQSAAAASATAHAGHHPPPPPWHPPPPRPTASAAPHAPIYSRD